MEISAVKTETWRAAILTFESKEEYANPFLDVVITAAFTGPAGEQIIREAYWDGGCIYRVSFAPTAPGTWGYALVAPPRCGLNGVTGTVEAVPYRGDLAIYRHGFLKVAEGGRHLAYDDGTPFFWLGDTHWEFAFGERWDESNHPEMDSQFKGMVDRRVNQGFTVYQTNLRSDLGPGAHLFWRKDGPDVPNVEFYQQELDRRMLYLADAGLINALGQAWFFSVQGDGGVEHQKHLARYLVARYGALPIVWTLAGEIAGYDADADLRAARIDGWREVALEIERRCGYATLQTAHYTNERPFADYYQDEDWFDFTLNQAGHGDYLIRATDYADFFADHPRKPFVEGEALYELCSTLEEMGCRKCTDDMLRRVAYMTIQMGGCGYTYGAQGIWDNVWEKPAEPDPMMAIFNRFGVTWAEAVDAPGAAQMGYMRRFYEENRFWELVPYHMGAPEGNLFAKKRPLATVSSDLARIIAYYGDTARKGLVIDGVAEGSIYRMRWFDPRTGVYRDGECAPATSGSVELPVKPDLGDWLAVLEREGQQG
ncbi:hypothetical protein Corgl_1616 [Coriobacterium glomerans PW2]|uniref:DUF4038 domain-containing protein n=1 Tax=Coriobacterium glomerans (strain ATCC 49209 / DSM 20642 / JCM 10262 / PW2) TaxID=700015 RepID=F2N939_CORGP|nr:DUF4038 domain-containing protein [Coriobacterium glomerans]AEB07715.1 hypothetical protein Corgl_1616 [Coriobacterium glomerans PW2]